MIEQYFVVILLAQAVIVSHALFIRMSPAHPVAISLGSLASFPIDQASWAYVAGSALLSMLALPVVLSGTNRSTVSSVASGSALALKPKLAVPFLVMGLLGIAYLLITLFRDSASPVRPLIAFGPAVCLAALSARFSSDDKRILRCWLLAFAGLQVGIGLLEVFGSVDQLWGLRNDAERFNPYVGGAWVRAQGSLGHPILYSFFMLIVFIMGLCWSGGRGFALRAGLVLAGLGGVFLSGTRAAAIALVVVILVHTLSQKRFAAWLRMIVVLVSVVAAGYWQRARIGRILDEALNSGSFQHRTGVLGDADRLLRQPLVDLFWGHGMSSTFRLFQSGVLRSPEGFNVVDNTFVYLVATAGLIGLVLFLMLLLSLLRCTSNGGRLCVAVLAVYTFSFDFVVWPSAMAIFLVSALTFIQVKDIDSVVESVEMEKHPVLSDSRSTKITGGRKG